MEGEADEGDICPILMFRQDDCRALSRKNRLPFDFDPVKKRENDLSNLSCDGIDDGISSHSPSAGTQFGVMSPEFGDTQRGVAATKTEAR